LKSRPVSRVGSANGNGHQPAGDALPQVMSREDEQAVLERLRELGYIE
jgi:hypothetical protein